MAIQTYISIITLKVKGLNAPAKRQRLFEWIKKKTNKQTKKNKIYTYAVYKKPTSDLKTQTFDTESQRMEKYISCKWEAKETWSSNPHIRQNRP